MFGFGLSFKTSGLDLDRKIWQSPYLWSTAVLVFLDNQATNLDTILKPEGVFAQDLHRNVCFILRLKTQIRLNACDWYFNRIHLLRDFEYVIIHTQNSTAHMSLESFTLKVFSTTTKYSLLNVGQKAMNLLINVPWKRPEHLLLVSHKHCLQIWSQPEVALTVFSSLRVYVHFTRLNRNRLYCVEVFSAC